MMSKDIFKEYNKLLGIKSEAERPKSNIIKEFISKTRGVFRSEDIIHPNTLGVPNNLILPIRNNVTFKTDPITQESIVIIHADTSQPDKNGNIYNWSREYDE